MLHSPSFVPWLSENLETVSACPCCGSSDFEKIYGDLDDITFHNTSGPFSMMQCSACAAGFLNPRPTPASIGAAYENYYTHSVDAETPRKRSALGHLRHMIANDYRWARFGADLGPKIPFGAFMVRQFPEQREVLDSYYRYLPKTKGRLLDFGCGNAAFMKVARDEIGWEVEGLDFDPAAVESARNEGFVIDEGGVEALSRWENHFDAITLSHVLEHVFEPKELMECTFRALKPGGFVFVETPNITSLCHQIFGKHWRGLEAPRHISIPSWTGMRELLLEAGFERLGNHPRLDVLDAMYKRSAALADGQSSEDPACLKREGPTADHIASVRDDFERCEYVTMTAYKPL